MHPTVSGDILVRPATAGVRQEPPLPVAVELAKGWRARCRTCRADQGRIREALVFSAAVELVPLGTLERSEYKSKLVRH